MAVFKDFLSSTAVSRVSQRWEQALSKNFGYFGGEEEGLALYFSPPLDLSCKFSFYVLACRLAHHAVSLFLESKVFVAGFPIYPLMQ